MKNIANRLIVFAVSTLAFGTVAFGQTPRITAEIPFAFHTATGVMPAGVYEFNRARLNGVQDLIYVQNKTTGQTTTAGMPIFDPYHTTGALGPRVDFVCVAGACSLKAIRTSNGSLVYNPSVETRKHAKESVAMVSVPAKTANGE
jgi:hypothetical protein